MRKWLAVRLRRWAEWLDPTIDLDVQRLARKLVQEQEAGALHTGMYKRAKAMRGLILQFPNTRKRILSMAIELAIQELK